MNKVLQIQKMCKEIRIGENDICKKCKEHSQNLSDPVCVWHVGEKFDDSKYRVLFVGKTAVGDTNNDDAKGLYDCNYSVFWSYLKEIANGLYPEDAWKSIALTNLIKCNTGNFGASQDSTNNIMKSCCIDELQVFQKELAIIRPKNIVFFTHTYYDAQIKNVFRDCKNLLEDAQNKAIGTRQVPWLSKLDVPFADFRVNILRTGHPQGKKKDDFCGAIINWIKDSCSNK